MGCKRGKPIYVMHRFRNADGHKAVEVVGQAPSYREGIELANALDAMLPGRVRLKETPTQTWAAAPTVLLGPCF